MLPKWKFPAVECAMSALPGIGDIGAKFLNAKNLVQTAQFVQSISHVVGNAYAFANTFKEASNNTANIYNSLKTGNADWGYVAGQAGAFALNVLTASLAAKDVAENMSTLKNMMSQSVKNVTKLASGQTCEGNGNCFVAGTLIVTSDGTKEIEDIEAGDYVLAKNTHTGEQEYREVTNVFVRETDTLILVTLEETIIETTETHPFYTEEGWKCAADLKAGERLELADGTYAEVTAVEVVKLDEAVKVYNFEVGEWHTYYVSEMEVLVHNVCNSETSYGKSSENLEEIKNIMSQGEMSSNGRRIVYQLDEDTRVIFGLDLGENAHPLRNQGYTDPVNHMNIEIQTISESGKVYTKWDMHMILDDSNNVIDTVITGPWKDK